MISNTIKEYFYFLNLNNPIEHIITTGIELPGSDQKKEIERKTFLIGKKGIISNTIKYGK